MDSSQDHEDDIGCGKAHFTWMNESSEGSDTPSKRTFRLRVDDDLYFKKGSFNLICGPTGSGKTSLLMALLREMHYMPLGPDSWVNLPRKGGVAYVAQESWIQNDTIRVSGSLHGTALINVLIEQHTIWRTLRRGTIHQRYVTGFHTISYIDILSHISMRFET